MVTSAVQINSYHDALSKKDHHMSEILLNEMVYMCYSVSDYSVCFLGWVFLISTMNSVYSLTICQHLKINYRAWYYHYVEVDPGGIWEQHMHRHEI